MGVQTCHLPCFILQPTGTPRPHINGFLWASKPAVCQPLNPSNPKNPQRLKTLTTRHGGPSLPFAMLHPAANGHPKAAHQWLLMGAQACRLAALKPLQPVMGTQACHLPCFILHPTGTQGHSSIASFGRPLQPGMGVQACRLPCFILQPTGTPRPHINAFLWASKPVGGPSLPFAILHPTANRHPKTTHQCLLMGVQACWGSKPAVCQPLNPSNPKNPQRLKTLTTRHGGPSLPFATLHPAAKRHPKATHQWLLLGVPYNPSWGSKPAICHASSCSQQAPQGHTSMAFYGRPSLPFASP